jgi:hypothetical protein
MAEGIGEVAIGLLFVPSEYQLDSDRYLIKIVTIPVNTFSSLRKMPLTIRESGLNIREKG